MVKIIMGTTHVCALSDRAASLEPVERAATLRPRAHSAARHMRETAIVNFRPGINDYRYITVANTLLNLILLHQAWSAGLPHDGNHHEIRTIRTMD